MPEKQKHETLKEVGAFEYTPQFSIKYKAAHQPSALAELDKDTKPLSQEKSPNHVNLKSRLRTF
jgi:hypothetical protein